jgi:glyoxylase-like metal-dependent hydrolase (beta-lactamase superfamily II)
MDVRELRPRLWYWTARHPDWTPDDGGADGWEPEVGCYSYVAPDGETLVLLDPLAPGDGEDGERFWRALDRDVERHGPPHVLLTIFWHARSASQLLERYDGARVWAHQPAREEVAERTPVTDTFLAGDALPAGLEAYEAGVHEEVAYRIPEYGAVVTGDVLIAPPDGPVRVWTGGDDSRRALRRLLEVPVELVLPTHGEPVLEGGRDALARALEAEG